MATGCHGTRRSARTVGEKDDEYWVLAECLLFGRAVDRLYLRSGLSSWLRAQPEWQRGTRHVEDPRVIRRTSRRYSPGNLQSRAAHPLLSGLRTIHREIRGERAACVSYDRGYSRSSSLGRKHANVDDEPIISVKGSRLLLDKPFGREYTRL